MISGVRNLLGMLVVRLGVLIMNDEGKAILAQSFIDQYMDYKRQTFGRMDPARRN